MRSHEAVRQSVSIVALTAAEVEVSWRTLIVDLDHD
jgi:hypothetical protein